jgi:hypothetical protein
MQVKGDYTLDGKEIMVRIAKYLVEGIMVATAAYLLPSLRKGTHQPELTDVLTIGLIAMATFSLLDLVAPSIGTSVRSGAGFGMGLNLVGFPNAGVSAGLRA